jgi:tetratricopeptide (TPR) repeat protein
LDFLLDKADIASQLNRFDTAITLCKEILKMEPECADAYIQLCFNYHAQDRYEEFLETFVRLMAIDDSHENLMFDFSFNFQIKNQYSAAKSLFEKLTEIYPLSKIAWFCLGVSQSALNLHQEAITSFEFCLSLDEEFAGAYFNLANVYHTMQNYPKAIELYQKTFEFESPDALAYSYIGECYLSLEKTDEAFDAFKKARDLDPELPEMLMGLALCLSEYGKLETAIHYAEKALTIQPNHAENIFILYELYTENDEIEKAEALIDTFCSDSDKLISLYLDFSDILYRNDKKELAYMILDRAQTFYPEDYSCTYRLANYCYAEGLIAESLLHLQIALEYDFAHRDVFLNYQPDIANDIQISAILTEYEKVNNNK